MKVPHKDSKVCVCVCIRSHNDGIHTFLKFVSISSDVSMFKAAVPSIIQIRCRCSDQTQLNMYVLPWCYFKRCYQCFIIFPSDFPKPSSYSLIYFQVALHFAFYICSALVWRTYSCNTNISQCKAFKSSSNQRDSFLQHIMSYTHRCCKCVMFAWLANGLAFDFIVCYCEL